MVIDQTNSLRISLYTTVQSLYNEKDNYRLKFGNLEMEFLLMKSLWRKHENKWKFHILINWLMTE